MQATSPATRGASGDRSRPRRPKIIGRRTPTPLQADEWPGTRDCSDKDLAKLHSEILQLGNQRFQLLTGAIVFFAAVVGMITQTVSKIPGPPDTPAVAQEAGLRLIFCGAAVSSFVLTAIFWYHMSFQRTIRWVSTYLVVAGSVWEWHWYRFRHRESTIVAGERRPMRHLNPFFGYNLGAACVFVALLLLANGYFFLLRLPLAPPFYDRVRWEVLGTCVVALAALMIFHAVHCERRNDETDMIALWRSIVSECAGTIEAKARPSATPTQLPLPAQPTSPLAVNALAVSPLAVGPLIIDSPPIDPFGESPPS